MKTVEDPCASLAGIQHNATIYVKTKLERKLNALKYSHKYWKYSAMWKGTMLNKRD